MPRSFYATVILLVTTVLSLNATGTLAAQPKHPKAVSFMLLPSNHMLIEARINDKGPYALIFDLGAPVTLLSNRAAEETGTISAKTPRSVLFSMRGEAQIDRLQLDDLTARKVPVIVLNHPALKVLGDAFGRRIDGIVGYTFFAHYQTTIDYQKCQMTFKPVNFKVQNLMTDLPDRLFGPKRARHITIAPQGLWGLTVTEPDSLVNSSGVRVTAIRAESAAAASGLQVGDILTSIDGQWTASVADTYRATSKVPIGQTVPVLVLRNGQQLGLVITPRPGI